MNILKAIKALFKPEDGIKRTYPSEEALRILCQMKAVEKQAAVLEEKHGADFNAFFYTQIPYTDGSHWDEKHVLNFPGPIYTGVTDNCGTGRIEAPENVMYDHKGREFIYCQPKNYNQLVEVDTAGAVDPFQAYGFDGNKHWNYELVKSWWQNRSEWIRQLMDPEVIKHNGADIVQLYIDYLNSDTAESDLRRYCFFLLNNYYPAEDNMGLPIIS